MMHIVVLCGLSVACTVATWLFTATHGQNIDDEKGVSFKVLTSSPGRLIYLAVMLLCLIGMSFVFWTIYPGNHLVHNMKLLVLLSLLFAAAEIDFRKGIIPNTIILAGLVLRVVFWMAELLIDAAGFWSVLKNDLIACLLVAAFFLVGVLLVKGGLGMGDIKLMLVMCLYQGFTGVVSSLFFSLVAAFFTSLTLLIVHKKNRKDSIAFAPAILVGTLVSVFLTGM